MSFKILLVDDDKLSLDTVKAKLSSLDNIDLHLSSESSVAARMIKNDPYGFAVVLLDLRMPGKGGIELARELIQINPHLILVGYSGDNTREALKNCMTAGIQDFIEKNTDPDAFREKIRREIFFS